jgi:hypothetical protein
MGACVWGGGGAGTSPLSQAQKPTPPPDRPPTALNRPLTASEPPPTASQPPGPASSELEARLSSSAAAGPLERSAALTELLMPPGGLRVACEGV